ncbi:hypothetical protein Lser_V15G09467 [Lactuca serriola]
MNWKGVEDMIKIIGKGVVELIDYSIIGFIFFANLVTKWKLLAFDSWLSRKGLDPSTYMKNLGITRNNDDAGMMQRPKNNKYNFHF